MDLAEFMLRIFSSKDIAAVERLFARRSTRLDRAQVVVRPILEEVKKKGDRALVKYAKQLDGLEKSSVRVSSARLTEARASLPASLVSAVDVASRQIRLFAEKQMPKSWSKTFGRGVSLGQIVRPLDSVGAYIPGGRYPLPSTLMMTVMPAQIAGVKTISAASPSPSLETLCIADYMGVKNFFHMGGAQAIAAGNSPAFAGISMGYCRPESSCVNAVQDIWGR